MEGTTGGHVGARARAHVRDRGFAASVSWAIAVLAWPVHSIVPGIGADWNWVATLSYAAHHGLRFGEQIVWSYGPLGFLNTLFGPVLFYDGALLLSWLFAALIQILLAGTLVVALRRSFSFPVAALVAFVVLAVVPDRALALGIGWCALALTRDDDAPRDLAAAAFPYAIGVLSAVSLLGSPRRGSLPLPP